MPQNTVNNKGYSFRNVVTEAGSRSSDIFFPAGMQPVEVADYLDTDISAGLNRKQIKQRTVKYGVNIIQNEIKLSFPQSIKNQLKGLITPLLIICSLLMFIFDRQYAYLAVSGVFLLIMFINALWESRASSALNTPRKYTVIKASVTREGVTDITDSRKLVPGDIIQLSEGMVVPCDARLIEDNKLTVLETPVSGNRDSVLKNARYTALADNELVYPNMVYAGSVVTGGSASAIVCYTGKDSLLRRLAGKKTENLPVLLRYVQKAGKYISLISIICCFVLLFFGVVCGRDIAQIFIISLSVGAVSLCDSMVSLAAAALGYGSKKMTKYGTVVKNLNSIPVLCGLDTIMCGKNIAFPPKKMTLQGTFTNNAFLSADRRLTDSAKELLYLSLACSDMKFYKLGRKRRRDSVEYTGKIYDMAVADYLSYKGYGVPKDMDSFIKVETEYSLTGDVTRVLVLYNGVRTVILKGAPEFILSRCAGYDLNGNAYKLSPVTRKKILAALEEHTQEAGFVIAIAAGKTAADNLRDITAERNLMFKGFITLYSSVDVDNVSAVYKLDQAGIEPVVASTDSYYSAFNLAKNTGILTSEKQVITAEVANSMDKGLFIVNCPDYRLFLNFSDSEWLQVLRYRKDDKRIVGATAERMEELTLIHEADVSFVPDGSPDMLKQTADVLLLSKGFSALADCLQNARLIFVRIHSVVEYLTVGAATIFLSTFFSVLLGLTLPFRAQEVLFGGLIFNLLFAVSLAFLPTNRKLLLDELPHYKNHPTIMDFVPALIYAFGASICIPVILGVTKSFSAVLAGYTVLLALYALTNISRISIFQKKAVANLPLLCAFIMSAAVMAALFLFEPARSIFGYVWITPAQLGITAAITGGYFILLQLIKLRIAIAKKEKKEKRSIKSTKEPDTD